MSPENREPTPIAARNTQGIMQHAATWWDALIHPEQAGRLVLEGRRLSAFDQSLAMGVAVLYGIYGLSMGLFLGVIPALISGLKLPLLYVFTLAVCFPAFYAINSLWGSRLDVRQCIRLLLVATSANAAALASYAPFSFFFTLTTSRQGYTFLVLMHVIVFGASAVASLAVIALVFRATAAHAGRRLQPHVVLAWGVLYAFVGTQMSWVLRPWVGSLSEPYAILRPIGGSFVEALWRLLGGG